MKRSIVLLLTLMFGSAALWAMPTQMTFQGTLKQTGVPVNGTRNMQFSFVDAAGATIAGTTPITVANVQVTNGLFAVQLPIDPNVPWESYSPFIQVSVDGQTLSPNQPLNANLYAVAAIPQGMIGLFAANCPIGWARFTALDNAFPMGGAAYGATGGSPTHNHSISLDGAHNHGGATGLPSTTTVGWVFGNRQGGGSFAAAWGDNFHRHALSTDGSHNHGGSTGTTSTLPPFVTMVYCQKL